MGTLLLALDLLGTFVFALSGATAGVKRRLDLFGVLGLSFAAGNAEGIARDLLIGAVPPAAITGPVGWEAKPTAQPRAALAGCRGRAPSRDHAPANGAARCLGSA